jgi:hypothetical protein
VNPIPEVQDVERSFGLTWGELTQREPQLNELLWQARAQGARCHRWQDMERVIAPFREALAELVGFRGKHCRHPVLGSVAAYEVV